MKNRPRPNAAYLLTLLLLQQRLRKREGGSKKLATSKPLTDPAVASRLLPH